MKYLPLLLIFVSCSTYKAYQKVAADPFVDQKESVLLSQKCLSQYPFKVDTAALLSSTVDSAAYTSMVASYDSILTGLIELYEADDTSAIL